MPLLYASNSWPPHRFEQCCKFVILQIRILLLSLKRISLQLNNVKKLKCILPIPLCFWYWCCCRTSVLSSVLFVRISKKSKSKKSKYYKVMGHTQNMSDMQKKKLLRILFPQSDADLCTSRSATLVSGACLNDENTCREIYVRNCKMKLALQKDTKFQG